MAANYATEVKLFGRWSFEDVEVKDISLEDYIAGRLRFRKCVWVVHLLCPCVGNASSGPAQPARESRSANAREAPA